MLDIIKSSFFKEILLFYLDEKRKLQLIKYNKSLQNKMNINIIDYRSFSGRYIIYGSKKNGEEYNSYDDKLVYKGEYLNGERNGKGREYYPDRRLKFEGEYLNGKRSGKGKEYYYGDLKFEGEYLNGKRNGEGKEYYREEILKFEGEYLNDKKWNGKGYDKEKNIIYELKDGKGLIKEFDYYSDKITYEGECLNGKRNGKGIEYIYDGLWFKGEFLNDLQWNGKLFNNNNVIYELKDGKGFVKEYNNYGNVKFEGEYLNGKRNGKGKEYDHIGQILFEGEYMNGERNGKGKNFEYYNNKLVLIYEGEYLNGKRNGKGKEYYFDKYLFEGEYLYNHKRKGKKYINGILKYEGEYLYDKKWNGKGYDKNGNVIYELINGKGKVKEYDDDDEKLTYEGEYLNGKRNGKGKEYYNNKLIFEGEYFNGKRWNGKIITFAYGIKIPCQYVNGELRKIL